MTVARSTAQDPEIRLPEARFVLGRMSAKRESILSTWAGLIQSRGDRPGRRWRAGVCNANSGERRSALLLHVYKNRKRRNSIGYDFQQAGTFLLRGRHIEVR